MSTNFSQTAAYIWSLADLLRGDFRQSQYGRIILPFTILRRLECVLENSKTKVLEETKKLKKMKGLEEDASEKFLLKAAGESFYNTSPMDLSKLGTSDIKSNLLKYVDSFSADAREIFQHFRFEEFIASLDEANLLFKVVQKVATTDLSPKAISNHDMGLVFEELIRKFAESSNDTAGEHFTPRDIVRVTTALVFMEDDEALTEKGIIRTIYDPTAGTGGFLSSGMEYVHELNPRAVMRAFGQELNPETYAICKGDMLIKGQDVSRIKLGNTLSDDQLYADKFDYHALQSALRCGLEEGRGLRVKNEHKRQGLRRPLRSGCAKGERWLAALPDAPASARCATTTRTRAPRARRTRTAVASASSSTALRCSRAVRAAARARSAATFWRATCWRPSSPCRRTCSTTPASRPTSGCCPTRRSAERKGKVQLINGVHLYQKMRKSLGSKRQRTRRGRCLPHHPHLRQAFEEVAAYSLTKTQKMKAASGGSGRGRPTSRKKKAETRRPLAARS